MTAMRFQSAARASDARHGTPAGGTAMRLIGRSLGGRLLGAAVALAALGGAAQAQDDGDPVDPAFRAAMDRLLEEAAGVSPDDPAVTPVAACITGVFVGGLALDEKQRLVDAVAVPEQKARLDALYAWYAAINAAHPDLEDAASRCG